jgi:hypothetical protein
MDKEIGYLDLFAIFDLIVLINIQRTHNLNSRKYGKTYNM